MSRTQKVFHVIGSQVDIDKVVFGKPKTDVKWGNTSISIMYRDKNGDPQPFLLRLDEMKTPFGVSSYPYNAEVTAESKLKVALALESKGESSSHDHVQTFFKAFETKILNHVRDNPELLGMSKDNIDLDVLESRFNKLLRFTKDKETGETTDKYPPNIDLKLIRKDTGELVTKIWQDQNTPLSNHDSILPGCWVESFVEISKLYVISGNFGVSCRALQILLKSSPTKEQYLFEDSDDED